MPDEVDTAETKKIGWYNPKNAFNGLSRMFGSKTVEDDATTNLQGELIWLTALGWIAGVSVGTANTIAGRSRLHLGPVYVW